MATKIYTYKNSKKSVSTLYFFVEKPDILLPDTICVALKNLRWAIENYYY
ncbi:MAG: hypothetical protein LBT50_03050 [Prevotellaceae bacterium]|jgi:hypothetical protein|nr:hypothetical protein [Prevotellaceae bacterium]